MDRNFEMEASHARGDWTESKRRAMQAPARISYVFNWNFDANLTILGIMLLSSHSGLIVFYIVVGQQCCVTVIRFSSESVRSCI